MFNIYENSSTQFVVAELTQFHSPQNPGISPSNSSSSDKNSTKNRELSSLLQKAFLDRTTFQVKKAIKVSLLHKPRINKHVPLSSAIRIFYSFFNEGVISRETPPNYASEERTSP
ncbi:hypothetical protein NE237_030123 [Protea cynaroides]|uniref:Uncharacterized protein n=1 Tax=Protea cynaroides TaxID=273540 RepID=A0A9Q0GUG6_9MAGN|nr:hypothetical protein NE237_030123 [Protea cynaroides]